MSFLKEKIVEKKTCSMCQEEFSIYEKDLEMLEKMSPEINGKKHSFSLPNKCPECRRKIRYTWRNTNKLFRRKCDATNKDILAFYGSKVKHPVYDIDYRNTDRWNPLDYGKDFDFSRPFFEQFSELKDKVPHYSRSILRFENSDYSNNASDLKNCYLCFNGGQSEDSYYVITFKDLLNCVDCFSIDKSENCYECIDVENCNKVFYSQNSKNCFNSYFIKNCINCSDCFLCKNLSGKKYHILNKAYGKEEYEKKVNELLKDNKISNLEKIFKEFSIKLPEKAVNGLNNENILGDYIYNSKNIFNSFGIKESEDLRYCSNLKDNSKYLIDVDVFGWDLEKSYNSVVVGHYSDNLFCCYDCWENCNNLYYCSSCVRNIKNCFGCVGLHNNYEYCILNKQYTKEDYEKHVSKIIENMQKTGEWGEFFPPKLSDYGYNETEGMFFDTMAQDLAIKRGFNWSSEEISLPKVEKIIPASKLPEDIKQIPDDILNRAIECEITKKPFRIITQELEFYRKHNLPIPRRHPDQRHQDRMALRNPRKLFDRKCDKCGKEIKTTYAPDKPEIVYCEECYNKEVY
ncbi:MAG: hypothetical protein PHN31_02250 [Candidatus Gracilibacteria bacterium]|nr:hypothetical protein [Candidatus Gracilibacteria bacterium]